MLAVGFHRELLQIGWESLQVLLVGENRHGLSREKVVVPNAQKPEQRGKILLDRRRAEMLVDRMKACEHRLKIIRADRPTSSRGRWPSPSSSAPANPIPKAEHVGRVDAELGYFAGVGRDRDKMPRDRFFVAAQLFEQPLPRRVRVRHRFERGERLRRDDEQRFLGVESLDRFSEVGAIDIRHEAQRERTVAVMLQRLIRHHRPKIGAADADIHDVANPLARCDPSTRRCGCDWRTRPSCRARHARQERHSLRRP